jgi:hypothetical protein
MTKPPVVVSFADLSWEAEYNTLLGHFHALWSTVDLLTDYAICEFLKVSNEEGHLITSGMMWGPKARLLAALISRSDHPRKDAVQASFGSLRAIPRDVIAHGYQSFSTTEIAFLERMRGGEPKAKRHTYTHETFAAMVSNLVTHSRAFVSALGADRNAVGAFADAALNLDRKSKTSPGSPTSIK